LSASGKIPKRAAPPPGATALFAFPDCRKIGMTVPVFILSRIAEVVLSKGFTEF
jgi:hypothetical protein